MVKKERTRVTQEMNALEIRIQKCFDSRDSIKAEIQQCTAEVASGCEIEQRKQILQALQNKLKKLEGEQFFKVVSKLPKEDEDAATLCFFSNPPKEFTQLFHAKRDLHQFLYGVENLHSTHKDWFQTTELKCIDERCVTPATSFNFRPPQRQLQYHHTVKNYLGYPPSRFTTAYRNTLQVFQTKQNENALDKKFEVQIEPVNGRTISKWLQPPHESSGTRANEPYALIGEELCLDGIPTFVTLRNLRCYPNLQLERLCAGLKDGTLHVNQKHVRQALQCIVAHCATRVPHWKKSHERLLQALKEVMCVLKIDECLGLQAIAEAAAVLHFANLKPYEKAHFETTLSFDCATRAMQWYENLQQELTETVKPQVKEETKCRQRILCEIALSCFRTSRDVWFSLEELSLYTKAIVSWANCGDIDEKKYSQYFEQSTALSAVAREGIITVFTYIVSKGSDIPPLFFSPVVALEGVFGSRGVEGWEWELHTDPKDGGYQAYLEGTNASQPNEVYRLCLITGTATLNGREKRTLPAAVLQHADYKEIIGDMEVQLECCPPTGHGVYRTTHPYCGVYLEFMLVNVDEVYIWVDDIKRNLKLQLLPRRAFDSFPPILRNTYRQWRVVSGAGPAVFFTSPCLLHGLQCKHKLNLETKCCLVLPGSKTIQDVLKDETPDTALDVIGQLREHNDAVKRSFECFERGKFIHFIHRKQDNTLAIHFARHDLTFVMTSNGELLCEEYREFVPNSNAYLAPYVTPSRLLLVKKMDPRRLILLIPREVKVEASFQVDGNHDTRYTLARYDLHPTLFYITTKIVEDRILLAAIFSHFSCSHPIRPWKRTGHELAFEFLRQCVSNEPLSARSLDHLDEIGKTSEHPSLTLMTYVVRYLRHHTAHLFDNSEDVETVYNISDCATRYDLSIRSGTLNRSMALLPYEYAWVIEQRAVNSIDKGFKGRPVSEALAQFIKQRSSFHEPLLSRDTVHEVESRLLRFIRRVDCPLETKNLDEFMASLSDEHSGSCTTEPAILEELKDSVEAFRGIPRFECAGQRDDLMKECEVLQRTVRQTLQAYTSFFDEVSLRYCQENELHFIANTLCSFSRVDILLMCLSDANVSLVFPGCPSNFRDVCFEWAQLTVLEEKLKRIQFCCSDNRVPESIILENASREILNTRQWDPKEYPPWLVMEVEQEIQIRPDQYSTTQFLLSQPHFVLQKGRHALHEKTRSNMPQDRIISVQCDTKTLYYEKQVSITLQNYYTECRETFKIKSDVSMETVMGDHLSAIMTKLDVNPNENDEVTNQTEREMSHQKHILQEKDIDALQWNARDEQRLTPEEMVQLCEDVHPKRRHFRDSLLGTVRMPNEPGWDVSTTLNFPSTTTIHEDLRHRQNKMDSHVGEIAHARIATFALHTNADSYILLSDYEADTLFLEYGHKVVKGMWELAAVPFVAVVNLYNGEVSFPDASKDALVVYAEKAPTSKATLRTFVDERGLGNRYVGSDLEEIDRMVQLKT